jgi:hypothetical protein
VQEEAVPQTLLNRPNLVTKAALVEQAYALAKYELDHVDKYDALFGDSRNACFSDRQKLFCQEEKDRILRHHAKVIASKRGAGPSNAQTTGTKAMASAPSPQLVAALRHVYGGKDKEGEQQHQQFDSLRTLLKSVMGHPAFAKEVEEARSSSVKTPTTTVPTEDAAEDSESKTIGSPPTIQIQLESLIGNVCQVGQDDVLHGLLIAVLSVLTSTEVIEEKDVQAAKGKVRDRRQVQHKESDPVPMPALQVGSLMSTLRPDEDDRNSWNFDSELLAYLGKAAASYEERIEIQKSRLLARLEEPHDHTHPSSSSAEVAATHETPVGISSDAIALPDDNLDEDTADAAAASLSATVFEQIIAAATGDETSSNEDGAGESSESDSDEDRDSDVVFDESGRQAIENNDSSSSSSGSEAEPGDDEQVESDEEDDDMVLRQALALSLVEQNQAIRVDTTHQLDEERVAVPTSTSSSCPVTPGNETPISVREAGVMSDVDYSPLPSLPIPPKFYPYASMLPSSNDSEESGFSQFFDPSDLSRFGTLPTSNVLVHLLRYSVMIVERLKFTGRGGDEANARIDGYSTYPVSGGIGCTLFLPNQPYLKTQKSSADQGSEVGVSLQLLSALFILVTEKRNHAIENLRDALAQESRGEGEDEDIKKKDGHSGTPLSSEEGDDPAIALALNYLDEEMSESKESLEAKGMRRKAAAAAHDAAEMLKSLRRRTDEWKERVKLYSHCALLAMKTLRLFLQGVTRRWLQERRGLTPVACHEFLPTVVTFKLSMGLASLSSVGIQCSFDALLTGNGEVEELLMPLKLYQEALMTWGECIPLVYPSSSAQVEILQSLLLECSKAKAPLQFRSLESLVALPSADLEPHFHRLHMLCRRLRVSDILDKFVSSPDCFLPEMAGDEEVDLEGVDPWLTLKEPHRASGVVALIGSSLKAFSGMKVELLNLYLALCHRCHVRILLWDGLFACTDPDADEGAATLVPSAGDIVRVSVNPSNSLQFDSTKCSDSIAILANHGESSAAATPNGSSVHQRASKVWGTVLSSTHYSPKTGVHRWAIRLDKCERGHVFVGVATAQASMRTYVGGDKYGWGMIGTQALWHDRRKIRGDYGSTFRTGSTIIVTLDTDAGTLSFNSWKDSSSSTSFALDPLMQTVSSPRRHGSVGGTVEDWGVAFEGLPLDSRLYPAVGLYQRDDRVTLLTVESGGRLAHRDSVVDVSGGLCYYPRIGSEEKKSRIFLASRIRRFNDLLSWDGIQYVTETLRHILDCLTENDDEFLLTTLLPSLAGALCLVPPTIPILSERCALMLLPRLTKAVKELEKCRGERQMVHRLFRTGLQEGKWVIRATGSSGSSSDSEEYLVDFASATNDQGLVVGFEGTGVGTTGKSKNGLVAIFGTAKGSSLHFVEEWTDGSDEGFSSATSDETASSCVVAARLSLDGKKFEGTYRNVQFGTTGQIAGLHCSDTTTLSKFRLKDAPASSKQSAEYAGAVVAGEALLCLAHSHMATIVSEDAAGDHAHHPVTSTDPSESAADPESHLVFLKRCFSTAFFSRMSLAADSTKLMNHVESLRKLYAPPANVRQDTEIDHLPSLNNVFSQMAGPTSGAVVSAHFLPETEDAVVKLDEQVSQMIGGKGSLSSLCPEDYHPSRRRLVCTFIHHCNVYESLNKAALTGSVPMGLVQIWRSALRIMEDGVRTEMLQEKESCTRREQCSRLCRRYDMISTFLQSLERCMDDGVGSSVDLATVELARFYSLAASESDIEYIKGEMERASKRALLRLIPIVEVRSLLSDSGGSAAIVSPVAIEALAVGIPRLLGRGYPERHPKGQDVDHVAEPMEDLGGNYLSNLSGSSARLLRTLRLNSLELTYTLGRVAEHALSRRNASSFESSLSVDSMILALLAAFTCVILPNDMGEVVAKSGVLSIIPVVIRQHRDSISSNLRATEGKEDEKSIIVRDLHAMSQREVSRSVLRAAVAAAHVIIYQASRQSSPANETGVTPASLCLDLLIDELAFALPHIENAVQEALTILRQKHAQGDWEKWCDLSVKTENSGSLTARPKIQRHQVGKSGVKYLLEHGMMQASVLQASSLKSSSRNRSSGNSSNRSGSEGIIKLQGNFYHQYLSHWLHIVAAVSRVSSTLQIMAQNQKWLEIMLRAVGLEPEYHGSQEIQNVCLRRQSSGLLPGRYRSRVLRLLLPLLCHMVPCDEVARGLFQLAGASSSVASSNIDEDEVLVSREAVSLLRHLHSPSNMPWRDCVNRAIEFGLTEHLAEQAENVDDSHMQVGVLCFFNGGIEIISRGTYVLLKPTAAVTLSADQQATPSSKGQSSAVGGGSGSGIGSTPHHLVGNGTEGIVAGLCRGDAAAGIVSSIDMKNGICEVILMDRSREEPETFGMCAERSASHRHPESEKGSRPNRHTLTVRALRSPLSDVVQAQEVPLFVDNRMPLKGLLGKQLSEAVNTLGKAKSGELSRAKSRSEGSNVAKLDGDNKEGQARYDEIKNQSISVTRAIMTLRACIVVLSDGVVLSKFLQESPSRDILSAIQRLACPDESSAPSRFDAGNSAHKIFMSSLPVHEARCGHLLSLLRVVGFRTLLLEEIRESEWESRLSEYQSKQNESMSSTVTPSVVEGSVEGHRTPQVELGSIPDTPTVVSSTAGGGSEGVGRTRDTNSTRSISQSTAGNENSEEDDDNEAAATAAAHLREAAIAQMAELGLPRSWSELALRRTGGTNIEAAVHFCLERGGEMERLLAEERERERVMQRQSSGGSSSRRRGSRAEGGTSNHLLKQLLEMGFPSRWCAEALAANGNNVDEALTWILTNGERLSAEDEGMEEDDDDDEEDVEDEEEDSQEEDEERGDAGASSGKVEATETGEPSSVDKESASVNKGQGDTLSDAAGAQGWTSSVVPLRFISGRSIIDSRTLAISGIATGGFSSVGTKGLLLSTGKWYYEAILETAGCLQIGWADGSFAGHCHADRGDGCGDGPSSWAYDGWRRYRWHATSTEWGCRWKEGDVVGCLADMDERTVSFTLNGRGEEIGMGVAFSGQGFRPCSGVYACVSFNRREKLRLILGGRGSEPFRYNPPSGYRGVGEAVIDAIMESDLLKSKELVLDQSLSNHSDDHEKPHARDQSKRFLCDFSDGEHGHELMAWAHRYYGADASVHLGSGRVKQSSGMQKNPSIAAVTDASAAACLSRRVEKAWSVAFDGTGSCADDSLAISSQMERGYLDVGTVISEQVLSECKTMSSLLARKLMLHVILTMGESFDPSCCFPEGSEDLRSSLRFWKVLEASASLRCAGWVGEAGAMAIAAEALGLGISSNDHTQTRHATSERPGIASISDLDDGIIVPAGGITQLLSSVLEWNFDVDIRTTGSSFAASAEAAIGSDGGGGVLVFLQKGLQGAVSKSDPLRRVIVAAIRRSIRLLAVVEYEGDDSMSPEVPEDDEDIERNPGLFERASSSAKEEEADEPDARLASFLTGLLLSKPVEKAVDDFDEIQIELFEAWSVGMLSASLPWRMVCAFSAAGILNRCPKALSHTVRSLPTLARFYGRLHSTVSRRVWAERAAVPVCSRYAQAMIELLASVKRATAEESLSDDFLKAWRTTSVDAATPLSVPLVYNSNSSGYSCWEAEQGWVSSDSGWEIWTGTVEYQAVDWKTPSRSAVRTLMDGGEGPPMLREGCTVMRGLDWDESSTNYGNDDGKDLYEAEKAKRESDKHSSDEGAKDIWTPADEDAEPNTAENNMARDSIDPSDDTQDDPALSTSIPSTPVFDRVDPSIETGSSKKKKKIPSPKLPIGSVLSIEPWNGIPALGRKVRWHLTGKEGVYRYGGDGGRYDISHVEANDKQTRVKKRHPLPESAEQCAARHGFGAEKRHSVLLRLRRFKPEDTVQGSVDNSLQGILEWPDFGSAVLVDCLLHMNGTVTITEKDLLYGSKDSGWEARFGQPSFVPGTSYVLTPTGSASMKNQADVDARSPFQSLYEELFGTNVFPVDLLRNRADGARLRVTSEMRLFRGKSTGNKGGIPATIQAPLPPPIYFDRDFHASSLSLSRDGRTVSCVSADGRGTAFASVGFTKGVHYWEVKLEQADIGSVFIGVAEKPTSSGGSGSSVGHDSPPRLNRWHGWGFVNFRATYTAGAERVYGAHCHAGDTVGVLLDCDSGRISFFFDGLKYGEHILNDLGCAFENISPFGFNVDGCGSGGAGQGAPSGIEGVRGGRYPAQGAVRPRALWPVVGLRNHGDRVTMSSKWVTSHGVDGNIAVNNTLVVDELLCCYSDFGSKMTASDSSNAEHGFPEWFIREAFSEYHRWQSSSWCRSDTRGSGPHRLACFGLDLDLDASPIACASASAAIGLKFALLAGDRVRLQRSAGRILELAEEAIVIGTYQGRLFYRIVSQKSEGGSLTEGGGRAWCWDESEIVDGLPFINTPKGLGVELPLLDRFKCTSAGGLKIVYEGGAVVRSDLEIFDGSVNLGSIPVHTLIPLQDVLERRVNSCGVVRYRVRYEKLGEGWISSRIRGGKEEAIVMPVYSGVQDNESAMRSFTTPHECAMEWFIGYERELSNRSSVADARATPSIFPMNDFAAFESLVARGVIEGLSILESDSIIANAMSAICDFSEGGDAIDAPFNHVATAMAFGLSSSNGKNITEAAGSPGANQAAALAFAAINAPLPSFDAIMARVALLRAFNRRARVGLPWLPLRPCQEGSAILGGLYGHGASIDRAGRNRLSKSKAQWVQVPSIASRIRCMKGVFFNSVKQRLLRSITEATTTPTPLSHDEYELPREIRTVRINRLKARRALSGLDVGAKRKHSVFAQLHNETKGWGGAALRRGFVAKGHGGQKRAFKVKLIGEGVNDYSGPYREAFTDAMREIVNLDQNGRGSLGVLDPSPNNFSGTGENRDLYMFSLNGRDLSSLSWACANVCAEELRIRESFSSLTMARDEASREVEEALIFLGRIIGTAYRHGIPLDLPLPLYSVWGAIVEELATAGDRLKEMDTLAFRQQDGSEDESLLLVWQQRMLNSFVEGLSNVIPVEVLTILTGTELRDILCGNPDVDVDLLRRVVEYEGYNGSDAVIGFFWETLREITNEERRSFLQFVWARNRLPTKESDFDAPFKIQRDASKGSSDEALPSASTCFFSLALPEYSSKERLKEKLLFAINNVTTMETDFQTNSAEIAEGYRAF